MKGDTVGTNIGLKMIRKSLGDALLLIDKGMVKDAKDIISKIKVSLEIAFGDDDVQPYVVPLKPGRRSSARTVGPVQDPEEIQIVGFGKHGEDTDRCDP